MDSKQNIKRFLFDVLLEEKDICNLKQEKKQIISSIKDKENIVVFGKRNTGKTSLIKNVIVPDFEKQNKDSFSMFVDLMGVKTLDSISRRIKIAFEKSFPLQVENNKETISFIDIFEVIKKNIASEMPILIVLDEFQDISFVEEAEGLLRDCFQNLRNVSIIVMGSKKHILTKMFANPESSFADFGKDIEFKNISYSDYYEYMKERLLPHNITLSEEDSIYWQDALNRGAESINIVGGNIVRNFNNQKLNKDLIKQAINNVIEERSSRFTERLIFLKDREELILRLIAKNSPLKEPSGQIFLKQTNMPHATVLKTVENLYNKGLLERDEKGYTVSNPLLSFYLLR